MNKSILVSYKTNLGTKEIEVEITRDLYIVNIIAYGEWNVEKVKNINELENLLDEYNIHNCVIDNLKEKILNA